ncbi:MAG TPA: ABC transporter substrate-binding protein [Symbiobacteriaceae bacterium]
MLRKRPLIIGLLVLSMILAACGSKQGPPSGEQGSSGEKKVVTVLGVLTGEEERQFNEVLADFERANPDIDVQYTGANDFATLIEIKAQSGDVPDIAAFPQPGGAARLARQGKLVELWPELVQLIDQNYKPIWKELGTVDGKVYGLFHRVNAKGWIWYNKKAFEEAGYQVPKTWDELIALTEQIKADGRTPWCEGIESGDATGWKGTDWIESILLRTQPPEVYDKWVAGELPFSSPEVKEAFEILGQIWMDPDAVYGGTTTIATTNVADAAKFLFDDPPKCYLHFQGSFATAFFPEEIRNNLDENVGVFILPPIKEGITPGLVVGGDEFVVFKGHDRPEVKKFMEWLATLDATTTWAKSGNALFPHQGQDLNLYKTQIERTMAETIMNAESARFDGSDAMPAALNRAFWKGITDWVSGNGDLDTILKEIDEAGKSGS